MPTPTRNSEYEPNLCIPPGPTQAPNLDRENARPPHCSCIAYRHCAPAALHRPPACISADSSQFYPAFAYIQDVARRIFACVLCISCSL